MCAAQQRRGNCLVRSAANRNVPDQICCCGCWSAFPLLSWPKMIYGDKHYYHYRAGVLLCWQWSMVWGPLDDWLTDWLLALGHQCAQCTQNSADRTRGHSQCERSETSQLGDTLMNYELNFYRQESVCLVSQWQGPLCLFAFPSCPIVVGPDCCLRWDKTVKKKKALLLKRRRTTALHLHIMIKTFRLLCLQIHKKSLAKK